MYIYIYIYYTIIQNLMIWVHAGCAGIGADTAGHQAAAAQAPARSQGPVGDPPPYR